MDDRVNRGVGYAGSAACQRVKHGEVVLRAGGGASPLDFVTDIHRHCSGGTESTRRAVFGRDLVHLTLPAIQPLVVLRAAGVPAHIRRARGGGVAPPPRSAITPPPLRPGVWHFLI